MQLAKYLHYNQFTQQLMTYSIKLSPNRTQLIAFKNIKFLILTILTFFICQ